MPQYSYQGRGESGKLMQGQVEAASPSAAAGELIESGITPISIEQTTSKAATGQGLQKDLFERRPSLTDLGLFARQMHTLTKSGVPIIQALNGLIQSTRNKRLSDSLKEVLESLESGRDFSTSLARHPNVFPPLFVNVIHMGEQSGTLEESLLQLSKYMEQEKINRDRIKSALRYPIIVITTIAIAIWIINLKVIPAFAGAFARFQAELPLPTRILIATSDFTVAYWLYILGALIAAAVGFIYYVRTEEGGIWWGKTKLRIPIFGSIIMRASMGRFAHAFAMSARAGVPLIQGLGLVASTLENPYIESRLLLMRNGIERGDTISKSAVQTELFTPLVLQMLNVGEETGTVDELMDEVAEFYEREVDYDLKTIGDVIEPLLLAALGIMVLILALGVFLPLWDLSTVAFQKR
jgi:MSHA biogenesis protein MshG